MDDQASPRRPGRHIGPPQLGQLRGAHRLTRIDAHPDFEARHLGPDAADVEGMLEAVGYDSLDRLIDDVVPESIRLEGELDLPDPLTEAELLARLRRIASKTPATPMVLHRLD